MYLNFIGNFCYNIYYFLITFTAVKQIFYKRLISDKYVFLKELANYIEKLWT
jgi:hypothetical protein